MKNVTLLDVVNIVTALAGYACIGIGLTIFILWLQTPPIAPYPYVALQYNSILIGMALLMLLLERAKIALVLGIFVTIGMSLFLVYLFLPEFLSTHHLNVNEVGLNTCFSFLLGGLSITLLSLKRTSRLLYCIALILAILILALAFSSLFEYTLASRQIIRASCFTITAIGIISVIFANHLRENVDLSKVFPGTAALFIASLSLIIFRAYVNEGNQYVQDLTTTEAEEILQETKETIVERATEMINLTLQWQLHRDTNQQKWHEIAESYRKRVPSYKGIAWLNADFRIQWMTPQDLQDTKFANLLEDLTLHRTLQVTGTEQQEVHLSPIFNIPKDGHLMIIYVPISQQSKPLEYMIGIIDIEVLLKQVLQDSLNKGFMIAFSQNDEEVMRFTLPDMRYNKKLSIKRTFKIYNTNWLIQVWPDVNMAKHHSSYLANLIMFASILIGLAMATLIRSYQISRRQTSQLTEAQRILKHQVKELNQHKLELKYLNELAETLQACDNQAETSPIIAKYCHLIIPATSGTLFLLNDNNFHLKPFAAWGKDDLKQYPFSTKNCKALSERIPYHISSLTHSKSRLCSHISPEPDLTYLCLPLLTKERTIGLLHIKIPDELTQQSDAYKQFLLLTEAMAHQLTLSLASLQTNHFLRSQAIRDPLTHLFNRRYLDESLQREMNLAERHNRPLSITMLDIDYFKELNDSHGHEAGDSVLKKIGHLLLSRSRHSDIACRFGGEEFVIVLPETTLENAGNFAEELRKVIEKYPFELHDAILAKITISIGVATFPEHGTTRETLLASADRALYQAKNAGRNQVVIALTEINHQQSL